MDSIGKKIKVTQEIVNAVGLKNVKCRQIRAEELNQKFDFVITRAVAVMPKLISWTRKIIRKQHKHAIPNGIWALKGIDRAAEEAESLGKWSFAEIYPMSEFFDEPYFETKCVVYIQK